MENIQSRCATIEQADPLEKVINPLWCCTPREAGGGSMEPRRLRVCVLHSSFHFTPWTSSVEAFLVRSFVSGVKRPGQACWKNRWADQYPVCLVEPPVVSIPPARNEGATPEKNGQRPNRRSTLVEATLANRFFPLILLLDQFPVLLVGSFRIGW